VGTTTAPGPQQKRLAAYLDGLAKAAGHADRTAPLKNYCTGLLLPGERKSVEPMAARLAPDDVGRMHQSLHHFVADAPWSDEALLAEVRSRVLAALQRQGPVVAWIVDDTGFPKKGSHPVGVARQYCGQLGTQDNCRVAVSLSVASANASLPIAYQLYLPESWANDEQRRRKAGAPERIEFRTKPQIAAAQIRQAAEDDVPRGVALADAGYGIDTQFRAALTELALRYVVGVQSSMSVWAPGTEPLPAKAWSGKGRPPKLLRRDAGHQPVSVKQLAESLPSSAWKTVTWRQGVEHALRSRFAALRLQPAHRDYWQAETHPEEWLLVEWPKEEAEPTKYWLSTLPPETKLKDLVKIAKQRWLIERDYEELKQELGLGHFEGRGWRGFHHHATLCIAAYALPGRREEPFFPLSPCRSTGITRARATARLPTARPLHPPADGIIRTPSPHSAEPLRAS
jgi:SRSO17 transposase